MGTSAAMLGFGGVGFGNGLGFEGCRVLGV